MTLTYYDNEQREFVHHKNVSEISQRLDYSTGLLEMSLKVGRCYIPVCVPITTTIFIGDEND